jgi:HEAT repeat protein
VNYSAKSGDVSEQFPNIAQILDIATQACQVRDWTTVIQSLQQLPVDRVKQQFLFPSSQAGNQWLDLALEVLKYGDFQQQWDIAKFLPKFGSIALESSIKIVGDSEEELESRWFAARVLAEFNTVDSILALVGLLQEATEEDLSSIASQSLASMGASAIDALNRLIDDESLRLPAVTALASMRHPETIEPLLRVAADRDDRIRILAVEALGSFRDPRIPPVLLQSLKDLKAKVRKEAAAALGMRPDLAEELNLVDRLAPLLYDLNPDVCRQTALALGRIGTKDATEVLNKVLQTPLTPVKLKLDLARSLAWNSTEDGLECLQKSLNKVEREICREIIAILGRSFPARLREKACTILLEFWANSRGNSLDASVKQILANSLGQLGDRRAIEVLTILAEEDDLSVVFHAKAALSLLSTYLE